MFCSQCATQLTPDDVYCPNCTKPVASFAFDTKYVAQVEPLDETPTVVRVEPAMAGPPIPTRESRNTLVIGIMLTVFAVVVGTIFYATTRKDLTPVSNVTVQNVYVPVTPKPTIVATVTPLPTPIDIDAQREKIETQERMQRNANSAVNAANAMARAVEQMSNQVVNVNPNKPFRFPPFDRNGRRLVRFATTDRLHIGNMIVC